MLSFAFVLSQVAGDWPMWAGEPSHRALQVMMGAIDAPVIKWSFATGDEVEWQFSAIADVDGDGEAEVVFGSLDRNVYCLRGSDGSLEWSYAAGVDVVSSPAVADVDGDGEMEVVVGSLDYNVYCLRGSDGSLEWSYRTGHFVESSPAVADVDGDGEMEVVVGSEDYKVYCLSGSDGSLEWSFPTGDIVQSSPAIADVDGDGEMEVVIGSWDHNTYCLSGSDGSLEWSYSFTIAVHTPGALADVDGDGKLEFLMPSQGITFHCLNAENGSLAWKMYLARDVHSPFVGDVDGDGCVEIVVGTDKPNAQGYRLFVIDDPYGATDCGVLSLEESSAGIGVEFKLLGRSVYLFLPKATQVCLKAYDISGKLVQVLYDGLLSQGGHAFALNPKRRGVYLVVLETPEGVRSLKLVR